MFRFFIILTIFLTTATPRFGYGENACDEAPWAIEQASKLSGMAVRQPANCKSLSRADFLKLASEVVGRDLDYKQLPLEEIVLKFLGIIPETYHYRECIQQAYASSAAAFYTPYLKHFVFPDWMSTPRVIKVHEAVHALQDQHFNTRTMGTRKFLLSDENSAAASVLEGDAMEIEHRYLDTLETTEEVNPNVAKKIQVQPGCELPQLLSDMLTAPYDYGLLFIRNLRAEQGDNFRKSLFLYSSLTSEQVLHYKKYLTRELATPIQASKGALFAEQLGEIQIRVWLRATLGPKQAVLAAAGWDGDTLSLTRRENKHHLRWATRWDTLKDAKEFRQALTSMWSTRFKIPLSQEASRWHLPLHSVTLTQEGQSVTLEHVTDR